MRLVGCAGCLMLTVVLGCTPSPRPPASAGDRSGPPEAGPAKVLTIGQPRAREGFGPWFMRGSGAILQYEELHSNFLVTTDAEGAYDGRLVQQLPSVDNGGVELLPDGRMRTTWPLRQNIRWHDGAAFSAEDVVFGWKVAAHPEIAVQQGATFKAIETVEAVDPRTVTITYRAPYFKFLELGFRELYPLPRHLLAEAFAGDKEAFTRLPYFLDHYIHTGPFRIAEHVLGERIVLDRFSDYFLGRPKLDRIIIRFLGDENAMVANLLAGTIDMTGELSKPAVLHLRDEWARSGVGTVFSKQGNWRFASVQFHHEWGEPPELRSDVRTRRGLLLAINRDAIREALFPGFPDTSGDTFMPKGDPRAPAVGTPFARYRYDPSEATRALEAVGWRRQPDGRLLNQSGQRVLIHLRSTPDSELEVSAVADDWRKLGIEVTEEIMSRALSQDREYIARFPGLEITSQAKGDATLRRFDSREQPLPENRYVGSNGGHYVNSEFDRLLNRLDTIIDQRQQGPLLRDIAEIVATDLPALPMHFSVSFFVAQRQVRALQDFAGAEGPGQTARNAHLWDRD